MSAIAAIAPLHGKFHRSPTVPLTVLLRLNQALKKTVFSRKFYAEINDKVLKNASSVDTNLYFICYFTLLLSSVFNNKQRIKQFLVNQRANVLTLINRWAMSTTGNDLRESPNKATAAFFAKNTQRHVVPEKKLQLAVHLKQISSYLSDIRIFNRLTDSIKYMPWIIDEYRAWTNPLSSVPKLDRFINFAQAINCLVLELLENAGWLTDHNWVGTSDNNWWCIETYIWCSRVWGAYLVIEIVELFRRVPVSKWDKLWRINVFKQMIQVPLVLHWSLYDGCLTPFWVGLCGSGASWWGFRDMWLSLDLD